MSNTARKARKRAGERFDYESKRKTGTPLVERASFEGMVPGSPRTRHEGKWVPRSWKKRVRALNARDLDMPKWMRKEGKRRAKAARKAARA